MQIARGTRTCRRILVEDFEGQIRPDLTLALLRRFERISDRHTVWVELPCQRGRAAAAAHPVNLNNACTARKPASEQTS